MPHVTLMSTVQACHAPADAKGLLRLRHLPWRALAGVGLLAVGDAWQFRDRRSRIEKDVVRTDRGIPMFADAAGPGLERLHAILLSYAFYNFDLSYCQVP